MRQRWRGLSGVVAIGIALLWSVESSGYLVGDYDEMEYRSCNSRYLFRVQDIGGDRPGKVLSRDSRYGGEYDVPWSNEQFQASFYRIRDGSEELVWGTYLPYPPRNCYVSNDGKYVVTVEFHYWVGTEERGMQIFGPNGELIRAYPRGYFNRVLNEPNVRPSVWTTTGPDSWHLHQYSGFTRGQTRFIVTLMQDEGVIYVDARTHKSVPDPPWPLSERVMVFDLETGNRITGDPDDDPIFEWGMIAVWIEMLESDDAEERLEGARGLADNLGGFRGVWGWWGGVGGWQEHALPVLMDSLNDPDMRVRAQVVWAIGRIAPETARAIAREYALSDDPGLRRIAPRLLFEEWDRRDYSLLVGLLQDSDQETAKRALARFHYRASCATLKNFQGIDLLHEYLVEHGRPGDDSEGNLAVLRKLATGSVAAGDTEEEVFAAQRAARDLARKLGVEIGE